MHRQSIVPLGIVALLFSCQPALSDPIQVEFFGEGPPPIEGGLIGPYDFPNPSKGGSFLTRRWVAA